MRFRLARSYVLAIAAGVSTLTILNDPALGQQQTAKAQLPSVSSGHDFDFLLGSWTVRHRWLKGRLVHSTEWETFSGSCTTWKTLGGQGDVDDNVLQAPAGTYRAVSLRSFDPVARSWSIWWLDSRHPHQLDPAVVGSFRDGVGTFFAKDTMNGRPRFVRFLWSDITANSAKWQQAFSDDGGKSWEANWVMEFRRTAPPRLTEHP
jgi:hypothetical protein